MDVRDKYNYIYDCAHHEGVGEWSYSSDHS